LSNLTGPNPNRKNYKVIAIKEIANKSDEKSINDSQEEQNASIQLKIEKNKRELQSLEQQKEKMLQDFKKTIDKEKSEWQEEKKAEQEQARELGKKIGFDQGKEEALQQYGALIDEANHIIEAARADYIRTIEKHEQGIVELALASAKKIIGHELENNPDLFASIIKKAIEELKDHSHVTIYLHPDDFPFAINQKEELEQLLEDDEVLSIYIDKQLNRGDCKIKHPFGQIDVGIDTQLEQIKAALEEKLTEN